MTVMIMSSTLINYTGIIITKLVYLLINYHLGSSVKVPNAKPTYILYDRGALKMRSYNMLESYITLF